MPDETLRRLNEAARAALTQLVNRLDENSYSYSIGPTWTIATTLVHLAFWDQRAFFLLKQWRGNERIEALRLDSLSVDSINHAVNLIALSVPGPAAGKLALESAVAVDAFVREIGDDLAKGIEAAGFERYLRRSVHRKEHLQKLHEVLDAATSPIL
jgi:hypothetical protein